MCCVCSELIKGGMYVNAWMCTIAFWNPSWSSHPLGIASILSSIVRKQICSLICVAHCNELAKYGQAFWKERESPHQWIYDPWFPRVPCSCACLSDMETAADLFDLFLHSHICSYVRFLLFFFINTRVVFVFFNLFCYFLTQAIREERPKDDNIH